MITCAVETSTAHGSVALFSENKLLGEKSWQRSASHSELLTDSFQNLLNELGISASDLTRVAVGVGPGSFTGVRVAINFARALAFARNVPVFVQDSLKLLAHQPALVDYGGVIHVIQYGFRDLVYAASYKRDLSRGLSEISAPEALTVKDLENKIAEPGLVLGDGPEKLDAMFSAEVKSRTFTREKIFRDHPLASDFFQTTAKSPDAALTDWIHTIPLYIRASEAEEKLKRGILKL